MGLAAAMLAACSHKDKDAPLAFVPADTAYVVASLKAPDKAASHAMYAQMNAQLPAQLASIRATAKRVAKDDPDAARLLNALATELDQQTAESFAQRIGLKIDGRMALYGLGMAPVLRVELADPAAFDAFIGRLETAYGKPMTVATEGQQQYRRQVLAKSGVAVVVATVGKQAVISLLPAEAPAGMLRQALGLDRPEHPIQDTGRLAKLAEAKGYAKWAVGDIDLTRLLPQALGGKDPLMMAVFKAQAEAESAKTGEPVANQLKTSPSCTTEAARIAARVPEISFGYTRLDAKHQDMRIDVDLADDISQPFAGITTALPGLGGGNEAPFDLSVALPLEAMRTFWSAQSEAVAAKPFECPALLELNDAFAKLGPAIQKTAIPPFGDLTGLRIALDSMTPVADSSVPTLEGRLLLASKNPAGLLAMSQMLVPALAKLKLSADGKPEALPKDMESLLEQPGWVAMTDHAIALGVGKDQQARLAESLKAAPGQPGQMSRMHLTGAMYADWLTLMEDESDALADAAAVMGQDSEDKDSKADAAKLQASLADAKARYESLKAQAALIESMDTRVSVDADGLVITSRTTLK